MKAVDPGGVVSLQSRILFWHPWDFSPPRPLPERDGLRANARARSGCHRRRHQDLPSALPRLLLAPAVLALARPGLPADAVSPAAPQDPGERASGPSFTEAPSVVLDPKVFELVVGDDEEPADAGYSIYRSFRIPSFHGDR